MDSTCFIIVYGLFYLVFVCDAFKDHHNKFSVLDFGAFGDGETDDTQAFVRAWNETCSRNINPTLVIPGHKIFLVNPVVFEGPCKAKFIAIQISGTIAAPESPGAWAGMDVGRWLTFKRVDGLKISGSASATLDGRGSAWWNQSCRYHPSMKGCTSLAPTAISLQQCNRCSFSGIRSINSAQTHLLILGCNGVSVNSVVMKAPGNSPNTDGIHIHFSRNIVIENSIFETGDDCVSIGDRTFNIDISNIICGPGHGISIGSLGKGGNSAQVENIYVRKSHLKGTTNGARIKTWQVGTGYVRGVIFEDITFDSVKNPIIIDQSYCKTRGACPDMPTGVQISNITYSNLIGTTTTPLAINFNCSRSVPCKGLTLQHVHLWPTEAAAAADLGEGVSMNCYNAYGIAAGVFPPAICLQD